jgi:hypothetical protein
MSGAGIYLGPQLTLNNNKPPSHKMTRTSVSDDRAAELKGAYILTTFLFDMRSFNALLS